MKKYLLVVMTLAFSAMMAHADETPSDASPNPKPLNPLSPGVVSYSENELEKTYTFKDGRVISISKNGNSVDSVRTDKNIKTRLENHPTEFKENPSIEPLSEDVASFKEDQWEKVFVLKDGREIYLNKNSNTIRLIRLNDDIIPNDPAIAEAAKRRDAEIVELTKNIGKAEAEKEKEDAEKEQRPRFSFSLLGGASQNPGAQGGLAIGAVGAIANSVHPTSGNLELYMGKPALRVAGKTELIPIHVTGTAWMYNGAKNLFTVRFVPIAAKGQLTVPNVESAKGQNAIGRSNFTVSPEFVVRYSLSNPYNNSNDGLGAEFHAGPAVGMAKDGDGKSMVMGPKGTLVATVGFDLDGGHSLHLNGSIGFLGSILKEMEPTTEVAANAFYQYQFNNGQKLQVGPTFQWDAYDVAKQNQPNRDSGITTFLGVNASFLTK